MQRCEIHHTHMEYYIISLFLQVAPSVHEQAPNSVKFITHTLSQILKLPLTNCVIPQPMVLV